MVEDRTVNVCFPGQLEVTHSGRRGLPSGLPTLLGLPPSGQVSVCPDDKGLQVPYSDEEITPVNRFDMTELFSQTLVKLSRPEFCLEVHLKCRGKGSRVCVSWGVSQVHGSERDPIPPPSVTLRGCKRLADPVSSNRLKDKDSEGPLHPDSTRDRGSDGETVTDLGGTVRSQLESIGKVSVNSVVSKSLIPSSSFGFNTVFLGSVPSDSGSSASVKEVNEWSLRLRAVRTLFLSKRKGRVQQDFIQNRLGFFRV